MIKRSNGYYIETIPSGIIIKFASLILPPGWLWCDGSLLLVADYPELYTAIGDTFGSTTPGVDFNLPDFRGRTGVCKDDMGISGSAGRITSATMNPDGITLGATGGLEEVVLMSDELPPHNHGGATEYSAAHLHYLVSSYHTHTKPLTSYSGSHYHLFYAGGTVVQWRGGTGGSSSNSIGKSLDGYACRYNTNYHTHQHSGVLYSGNHNHTLQDDSHNHADSLITPLGTFDVPHLNVQPSIIVNRIIKY